MYGDVFRPNICVPLDPTLGTQKERGKNHVSEKSRKECTYCRGKTYLYQLRVGHGTARRGV